LSKWLWENPIAAFILTYFSFNEILNTKFGAVKVRALKTPYLKSIKNKSGVAGTRGGMKKRVYNHRQDEIK